MFSGDDPCPKGEASYKEWKFEVKCAMSDPTVSPSALSQAIRRSIRGSARQARITLGEQATVAEILDKMDSLFANAYDTNNIMQEFFNAHQLPNESVTAFACRLEYILTNASDFSSMSTEAKNEMLRCKFWTSLSSECLKAQTRHKFDSVKSYQELIKEIRLVEHELSIINQASTQGSTMKSKVESSFNTKKVSQNVLVADNEFEQRLSNIEKSVDSKFNELDRKLNAILKSLSSYADSSKTPTHVVNNGNQESVRQVQSRSNWRGNWRNRGMARGRGFEHTQNHPNA